LALSAEVPPALTAVPNSTSAIEAARRLQV